MTALLYMIAGHCLMSGFLPALRPAAFRIILEHWREQSDAVLQWTGFALLLIGGALLYVASLLES